MRPLNVLTGVNASGKSTAIQALLVLSQTIRESDMQQRVLLNGKFVHLGSVADVVDQLNSRNSCDISVESENHTYRWSLTGERTDASLRIERLQIDEDLFTEPEGLLSLVPIGGEREICTVLRGLNYLSAERFGPRELYPVHEVSEDHWVGSKGEYAPSVLFEFSGREVSENLTITGKPATLFHQVEARMQEFFPNFGLDLDRVAGTNSVVLKMRSGLDLDFSRPINNGFGFTQVFPIIVAALVSSPDGLIIVENPEVHLHPRGQSIMGQFLAQVASAGIQVILETHSDHVLNGIRKAVKQKLIQPTKVGIHYFSERSGNNAQIQTLEVNENGSLDHWPTGFFDQFDNDLGVLITGSGNDSNI
ncbi:MAG: DUF3696 domain-containing protein [Armatimonadetes bacterium]|nr:DUF3696 domain-containing protein [Armatimonadota bacterium]